MDAIEIPVRKFAEWVLFDLGLSTIIQTIFFTYPQVGISLTVVGIATYFFARWYENNKATNNKSKPEGEQKHWNDKLGFGLAIFSFCIPLAGAIIYFSNKNSSPNKAKSAGYAALIGFGLSIGAGILNAVIN